MTNARVPLAESQAAELLNRHGITQPPVPVDSLAEREQIDVRFSPLEDGVSALLVLIPEAQPVIAVNSAHHVNRRRFSVAHELGHYEMHRDQSELFVDGAFVHFRDGKSTLAIDPQEIEANAFAAALLMPAAFLEQDLGKKKYGSLEPKVVMALARRYKVSEQALKYRLVNLGFMPGLEE